MAPMTFTKFLQLPTEVRQIIWQMIVDNSVEPRRLMIEDNNLPRMAIPSTLQINAESREVALRTYRLLFEGSTFIPNIPHYLYFVPDLDVVVINDFHNFDFPRSMRIPANRLRCMDLVPVRECDSVRNLEFNFKGRFMDLCVINFRSLNRFIVRSHGRDFGRNINSARRVAETIKGVATVIFTRRLRDGHCDKIPEIIVQWKGDDGEDLYL